MTDKTYLSNTCEAQRKRLLEALKEAEGLGVTSYYANRELDIYHPPARIKELRQMGWRIETLWETVETDLGKHRVGRYVLVSKRRETRRSAA